MHCCLVAGLPYRPAFRVTGSLQGRLNGLSDVSSRYTMPFQRRIQQFTKGGGSCPVLLSDKHWWE